MTPQPPRELFVSERPVRSSDDRIERSYARRRLLTVAALALAVGGGAYGLWGGHATNPADIPTIKAESGYRQKPADPGGIDIPHQDLQVYDQLEGKTTPPPQVEHLLPPPETPADVPHAAPPDSAAVPPPAADAPMPVAPVPAPADALLDTAPPKPIATTVAPVPVPAPPPIAPPAPLTIDQIIKQTQPAAPPPAPAPVVASGAVVAQLASVTDPAAAQSMIKNLQYKYAAQLGGISLHVTRADLGTRGVFYRIQSQGLSADAAAQLCASLKKINAGCILVHP